MSGAGTGGRTIKPERKQTMQAQKLARTGWSAAAAAGTTARSTAGRRFGAASLPATAAAASALAF